MGNYRADGASGCKFCRPEGSRPLADEDKDGVTAYICRTNDMSRERKDRFFYTWQHELRGKPMPEIGPGYELCMTAYYDGGYVSGGSVVPINFCPFCGRDLRGEDV